MHKRPVSKPPSGSGSFQEPLAPLDAAMADLLDYLPLGVIQVDVTDDVVFMNAYAREIVAKRGGLSLRDDCLVARTKSETAALRKLIAMAVKPKYGDDLVTPAGAISLSRRKPLRPLQVIVKPLHRLGRAEARAPAATIFVGDPEVSFEGVDQLLMRLYDLTATEARLAVKFIEGKGAAWAAAQIGIGLNTARSHLQRIFGKTRTNRQVELVKSVCHIAGIGVRCGFDEPPHQRGETAMFDPR